MLPEESPSYAKGLFLGEIEEDRIFPYPAMPAEEAETVALLLDPVERFLDEKVDSAAIDQSGVLPEEVIKGVAELGLMGLIVPEAYGGLGLSMTAYARVMEMIAGRDASAKLPSPTFQFSLDVISTDSLFDFLSTFSSSPCDKFCRTKS